MFLADVACGCVTFLLQADSLMLPDHLVCAVDSAHGTQQTTSSRPVAYVLDLTFQIVPHIIR